ncbi:zinc-binding alcohol dehydrogenase family protein [Photobacterium gaetbulicola]|uniref:Zinc-type alcohol dehydrogenase-like protein n=1 Tax=Photobacterium gaetbulicola Gung47 TaxID=658445 RepID=A0A0C5WH87_9GAMM|nr:zinc-binding alcohol dehydrogenase family protein [Photobacterium gaetbulicola]AJR05547.1 zinc-binding alcohol dehydrogenase family protein [Photobacterium gaetbulicola Gung47]PSU14533.1 zinc-binding alcohol dehydrogenase family protein [Photobacterium gaetbulicola]
MKAVGYQQSLPVSEPQSLVDITFPEPVATGSDILVEVKAISVNPVDTKVRMRAAPEPGQYKILGWDAAGIVKSVGPEVTLFKPGDKVWYAGDLTRSGSNAEYQLVDEKIVGHMPASLDFAQAAALPLTTITAWEMLFDRLQVEKDSNKKLLIIGAAGGVGSIMVQLAKKLTNLTVIGTASRPETQSWLKELGADHVINHRESLSKQLAELELGEVDYIVSLTNSDDHLSEIVESIKPQGKFGLIDDPASFDILQLKRKSISLHWEFMYTRSLFGTEDMIEQHHLLNNVAKMVDNGDVKSTIAHQGGKICADNLKKAHELLESQRALGKIVLEGF